MPVWAKTLSGSPHEPLQGVNVVNGLVHQRPAIHGPRSVPAILVVLLRAVPAHRGIAEEQAAQAALVNGAPQILDGRVVAVLQHDA